MLSSCVDVGGVISYAGQCSMQKWGASVKSIVRAASHHAWLWMLCVFALALAAAPSRATEYSLSAFFVPAEKVAAAIGSNDQALLDEILANREFVENYGLEERFSDPDTWKYAVTALIAGEPRENEFINAYALEMLLWALISEADYGVMGLPFADLDTLEVYFRHAGDVEFAAFLARTNNGNTAEDRDETLPASLRGLIGRTEYPARLSVLRHQDAKALIPRVDAVDAADTGIEAYWEDETTPQAKRFIDAVTKAETEQWSEFASNPSNVSEGETPSDVVTRMVASTLEDPYIYTDSILALYFEADKLRAWLKRASNTQTDLFLVYSTF